MTLRNQVIGIIRSNQAMLAELGVLHAAVFGSVARGDDRPHVAAGAERDAIHAV